MSLVESQLPLFFWLILFISSHTPTTIVDIIYVFDSHFLRCQNEILPLASMSQFKARVGERVTQTHVLAWFKVFLNIVNFIIELIFWPRPKITSAWEAVRPLSLSFFLPSIQIQTSREKRPVSFWQSGAGIFLSWQLWGNTHTYRMSAQCFAPLSAFLHSLLY